MTGSHASGGHVTELLGGYALGLLDDSERRAVDEHLPHCPACWAELGEVADAGRLLACPPRQEAVAALIQEPAAASAAPGGADDLVLRRTLRAMRSEQRGGRLRRALAAAAGIAVLAAAAVGGGFLAGAQTADRSTAEPSVSASPTLPAGSRVLTASDTRTGVNARVTVTPAKGWIRLAVKAQGIDPGEHCRLTAITRSGDRVAAGSWVVAAKPDPDAPPVSGSAVVAPDDLAAVEIATVAGKVLVTVRA